MRRYPSLYLFSALGLITSFSAEADSRSTPGPSLTAAQVTESSPPGGPTPEGWKVFGSAGAGYGATYGQEFSQSPDGSNYRLGLAVSLQIPRWVADGGVDWTYSTVGGRNAANQHVRIRTRAGLADASIRYRLTRRLQLGLVFEEAFGTDTSLAASIGPTRGTAWGGVKAVYEFPISRVAMRVWAELTTDLGLPNRQALLSWVGVQFGIPVSFSTSHIETPTVAATAAPARVPAAISAPVPELRVSLDPQVIFFRTKSAQLKPAIETALHQVGEYLGQNPDRWRSVTIEGHADKRGLYKFNLKLSDERAHAVLEALAETGVDPTKLSSQAFSYLQPLDPGSTPQAFAKTAGSNSSFATSGTPRRSLK